MSLNLSKDSLDWAIRHAVTLGDTDVFPPAFEYKAIQADWPSMRELLSGFNLHDRATRPHRQALSPKGRYGFRIATQLDPLDFLIFAALLYEIGDDLEARRVPKADGVVFSSRFKPNSDGTLFDLNFGYSQFQQKSREYAESGNFSHVVVTDIADFFHRIYSHDIHSALEVATKRTGHITAIDKLIRGWNQRVSISIPVGPAPSRLLAEILLDDIDRLLLSEGVTFVRFVDDYRIFCQSAFQAHEHLALLANSLFHNHTLTLQQHKTNIYPIENFSKIILRTEPDTEISTLTERFKDIVEILGLENPSDTIDYDELDEDVKAQVDALNLGDILLEQVQSEGELDIQLTRFVLRRLGQLGSGDEVSLILDHADRLYPVLVDVIRYLASLVGLTPNQRSQIGGKLIDLLSQSIVSHLDYHRSWLLYLFTQDIHWDNEEKFVALMGTLGDSFSQRKLMLALGRANRPEWFRSKKQEFYNYGVWVRRAFLAGASCLPGAEKHHWYQSVEAGLDELEQNITGWARGNPFA